MRGGMGRLWLREGGGEEQGGVRGWEWGCGCDDGAGGSADVDTAALRYVVGLWAVGCGSCLCLCKQLTMLPRAARLPRGFVLCHRLSCCSAAPRICL